MYDAKLEISRLLTPHVADLDTEEIYDMLEVPLIRTWGIWLCPAFKQQDNAEIPGSDS